MPRPTRCRRICEEPYFSSFSPLGEKSEKKIEMTVDEFETIRLVDYEKKTHDECSLLMDVSRTTVTEIYERARYKLADAIVNGKSLCIKGGNYRLCEGSSEGCSLCGINKKFEKNKKKGENIMKIAVTYEDGKIFQHFGHTEKFKIYEVEKQEITKEEVVDTEGQGHGALASFLSEKGVDVLICGGIGGGAQMALAQAGIKIFGGVSEDCDRAVKALLDGTLDYNPDVRCSHHDHEHGEAHTCGSHGCGKANCH